MLLGIDHLVIAVHDPDAAIEELSASLGVAPGGGGTHPSWGTRNRLIWLGDTFIELLGVSDARLAAGSWLGAPALAALRTGPALVGWAIATSDLEGDVAILRAAGAELGPIVPGERRRPDGRIVRWRLALPPEVAMDRPFLIEHDSAAAEWSAEDRAERAAVAGRITKLELPVDAIEGMAPDEGEVGFGDQAVRLAGASSDEPAIRIEGVAGRGQGSMLGCRWLLESAADLVSPTLC